MGQSKNSKTTGRRRRVRAVAGPVLALLGAGLFLQSLPKGAPVSTPKGKIVTTTTSDEALFAILTATTMTTIAPQVTLIEALEGDWTIRAGTGAPSRIWAIRNGVVTEVTCTEGCLPSGTGTLKSFDDTHAFVVPPQTPTDPPQQLALTECLRSTETCRFDRLHFGAAAATIEKAGMVTAVKNDSERQIWLRG